MTCSREAVITRHKYLWLLTAPVAFGAANETLLLSRSRYLNPPYQLHPLQVSSYESSTILQIRPFFSYHTSAWHLVSKLPINVNRRCNSINLKIKTGKKIYHTNIYSFYFNFSLSLCGQIALIKSLTTTWHQIFGELFLRIGDFLYFADLIFAIVKD